MGNIIWQFISWILSPFVHLVLFASSLNWLNVRGLVLFLDWLLSPARVRGFSPCLFRSFLSCSCCCDFLLVKFFLASAFETTQDLDVDRILRLFISRRADIKNKLVSEDEINAESYFDVISYRPFRKGRSSN